VWRVTGESLASIEACVQGPLAEVLLGWTPTPNPSRTPQTHSRTRLSATAGRGLRASRQFLDLVAQEARIPLVQLLGGTAMSVATDVTVAAQGDFGEGVDASQFRRSRSRSASTRPTSTG